MECVCFSAAAFRIFGLGMARADKATTMTRQQIEDETEARGTRMLPGGAPDQETFDLMVELDRLQTWTTLLMGRQVPMAREAYDLVQRTRCFIVERLYSGAREHRKDRDEG